MNVERLTQFNDEILAALKDSVRGNAGLVRAYIDSGIAELWRINNGESYAVTVFDKPGSTVWVLCYAGANVAEFSRRLKLAARKKGYTRIVFSTHKPGIIRLMKRCGFKELGVLCEAPT